MKVVALVSGGKDSCYAMMKCIQYGHQIVALANLMPADDSVDELDSYMYQTVGHQIVVGYAECMGVPLFRRRIQGSARHQKLNYKMTCGDEVEDMVILLNEVKRQIPSVTAVSSGAIASDYQRLRVESVCSRLGLVSLAYLWKQDQSLLLGEMITSGILAITVKVAAMGLNPAKHLGKEIAFLSPYLHKLKELYGINVCGEGGEYETLTLDCPLFKNARIVLDKFETVLHSSDSIAPVGILHPLEFHLEKKESDLLHVDDGTDGICYQKNGYLFEVQGHCPPRSIAYSQTIVENTHLIDEKSDDLLISKAKNNNTFSICCWLQDFCRASAGLEDDLQIVLKKIESQLMAHDFGWEHVLYIHLYIADMTEFTLANEMYVKFITQEKCPIGVPSRSCIALPLLEAGLGRAYIEVLVANDQSKSVLHVQSISSWTPSCIGPYSQATLHKGILYMAGQLGLDPPTMTLCNGGPFAELEQALKNSDAVAKCFNCSIFTSTILLVIYYSSHIPSSERAKIQDRQESFCKQMKAFQTEKGSTLKSPDPVFLYVLVPDLPKGALVEVKPVLYIAEDVETASVTTEDLCLTSNCWGFQHARWHDSCIKKCIVHGNFCAIVMCITNEVAVKISSGSLGVEQNDRGAQNHGMEGQMKIVSRFCVYLLDKVLVENGFSWEDTMNLRIYYPANLDVMLKTLSLMFAEAFKELSEMGRFVLTGVEPIFNLVPVLGAGRSAETMDNRITCELFAQKS
ncbi:hypothetical protein HS088_TW06G01132 [Tripterygium wilfordii]|uniref:Diphthine--ammonia ligase n=1 Tax=Tripterygium wilfordii TaxID=458696 RepID=A0A7J7DLJ3_TRIWF|nr:diphthine--ammonia ligase [Tripterygium wilfordii]XP_038703709.1 diphthine--ammonia ligase [Tripterygium wilfordii]KAF5746956.1 hypothetical protein HS088_TW06G01132 [Tripterygium wilfordii]